MSEHDYDVDNDWILGLQSILFKLEENLRGVTIAYVKTGAG
jgi:hypothetical protein